MGGSRSPAFSAHTRPRQLADELLRPKGGPEIPSDLKGVEDCEYTQFPLDPKTDQVTEDKIRLFVEKLRSRFQAFITTFDLVLNDNGEWENGEFINEHNLLIDKYNELLSRYNKLVRDYNHHAVVPQPVGRPIAASEAQQAEVAKHHKRSKVARWIAEEQTRRQRSHQQSAPPAIRARAQAKRLAPGRLRALAQAGDQTSRARPQASQGGEGARPIGGRVHNTHK
jgi:hypothetical protein